MLSRFCGVFLGLLIVAAPQVSADTQDVSSMAYGVVVEEGDQVSMTNGNTAFVGGLFHSNVINNEGEHFSQWCRATGIANAKNEPLGTGGYCTLIDSNGDVLWVWFRNMGPGSPGVWGAIGGTGAWAGATGGGTTESVSQSPDGRAAVNKTTGTITTP